MSAPKKIQVSGVTMVRNAQLLDYPFRESVLSVLPLCDEFIISCGDSTDKTREICEELKASAPEKVRIIDSVWTKEKQAGGFQLKAQTDRVVQEARGEWCFVIQADEVIHEADLSKIREAMTKAEARPEVDGILFDYIHFYGSHHYSIRGRNWYRREVRLFKTHRNIEAFRDAQGFRKNGERISVIRSDARVFHYGYVRSSESLEKKASEMARWWGQKPEKHANSFTLHRHIGLKRFKHSHPAVMKERITRHGDPFNPKHHGRKWDKRELKNFFTLIWESIFPFRIGEFRNYEVI